MPDFLEEKAFPRQFLSFAYLLDTKEIDKYKTIARQTRQRIIIQSSLKDYSQEPYYSCGAEWTSKKDCPPGQSLEKPKASDKSSFHRKSLTSSVVGKKRQAKVTSCFYPFQIQSARVLRSCLLRKTQNFSSINHINHLAQKIVKPNTYICIVYRFIKYM